MVYSQCLSWAREFSGEKLSWPLISADEALKRLKSGTPAIDVRSQLEFCRGSVPGFKNIPILNNEHRHLVGLTYKQEGHNAAVELGHKLVDPLRANLVRDWSSVIGDHDEALLTCWRGGLRSRIATEWLSESGFRNGYRVDGGYKAMRHVLLGELERSREWLVLGGMTGCGKTDLLRELEARAVLDLEWFARHRGSAFGGYMGEPQPPQQSFENSIGLHLFANPGAMIVEGESGLIGTCSVPLVLRRFMRQADLVVLEAPMEERVQRIFNEYVKEPLSRFKPEAVRDSLVGSIGKIEKALGGALAAELRALIHRAFEGTERHGTWIECLLRRYYDPAYEFSLKRDARQIRFQGNWNDVSGFLKDFIDRRRAQSCSIS